MTAAALSNVTKAEFRMPHATKRRDLLAGAAALAGGFAVPFPSFGQGPRPGDSRVGPVTLTAGRRTVEVKGRAASVFGITQPDGTAGLFTEVGKPFQVVLNNDTGVDTLLHWHGLTPPWQQDGVPGISAPPVAPGDAASYDFPLTFPGTFWMHSHQGLQEQSLFSAPLIVRDPAYEPDRQEVVLLLHDFSFKSPDEIYAGLRGAGASPAGHAMDQTSAASGKHMQGMAMPGMAADAPEPVAGAPNLMPGMDVAPAMKMSKDGDMGAPGMPMDLNDVVYDAFLANDRTLDDPQVVRVERGGRVLLRVINGSAASNFQVGFDGLPARLLAVDGHAVQPVAGSAFPVAIAQRLDLAFDMPADRSVVPVFAVLEGERKRTGIVLATATGFVSRLPDLAPAEAAPLNFAQEQALRAAAPLAAKATDRTLQVDLTGSMEKYVWGLNGKPHGQDTPLMVAKGERVELVMTNRTMMSHPMHLHGHAFQVVEVDGQRFLGAVRDTVLVLPMNSVTVAFDADNPGHWAFHCHNLYHMEAGMMTTVRYEAA